MEGVGRLPFVGARIAMVIPTRRAIPPIAIAQRTPDERRVLVPSLASRATVSAGAASSAGSTAGRLGSAQVGPGCAQAGVGLRLGLGVVSVGPGPASGAPAAGSGPGG